MREPIPVGIIGIGRAVPPHVRENDYWDDKIARRDETQRKGDILAIERKATGADTELSEAIKSSMAGLDDLYRGAVKRHVLAPDAEVSDLEAEAARHAIADAKIDPNDIDVVLSHAMLSDLMIPLNGPIIQHKLGLKRAVAWNIEAVCASFQAQLVIATGLVHSGLYRNVLIVQSAAQSRMIDYAAPMSIGFGDAASAAVVSRVPDGYGLMGHYSRTDGSMRDGVVVTSVVDGEPRRDWWNGGGPLHITSFDRELGKSMGIQGPEFCKRTCLDALAAAETTIDQIDWFVCNQSVGWFVDACRKELGIPAEKAISTFPEVANIGATAIVYNLAELKKRERLKKGHRVLMYSPGGGFTRSAAVIRWFDSDAG